MESSAPVYDQYLQHPERQSSFPGYEAWVKGEEWKPRPDYTLEGEEVGLSFVVTDQSDEPVAFAPRATVAWGRRWSLNARNVYLKLDGREVEFPETSGYRGVGVFGDRVVLVNSKAQKKARRLRLLDLQDLTYRRDLELPEGYSFVDALLPEEQPLRLLVQDGERRFLHLACVSTEQVEVWRPSYSVGDLITPAEFDSRIL